VNINEKEKAIECYFNRLDGDSPLNGFGIASLEVARDVALFHESLPGYSPTPLITIPRSHAFCDKALAIS